MLISIVKRLLGLAYFGVVRKMRLKCRFGLPGYCYTVLIDLTDAVAEALNKPLRRFRLKMVYRSSLSLPTLEHVAK